jgi:hypothetical protein
MGRTTAGQWGRVAHGQEFSATPATPATPARRRSRPAGSPVGPVEKGRTADSEGGDSGRAAHG